MNTEHYLQVILAIERKLAEYFIKIAEYHKSEQEIYYGCQDLAAISSEHIREIRKIQGGREGLSVSTPGRLNDSMIRDFERGNDLETDLRLLWLLSTECGLYYSLLQHSSGPFDKDISLFCSTCRQNSAKQSSWLFSRIMLTSETVPAGS